MRTLLLALVCAWALAAASAGITPDEYKARRANLRKTLDGVVVLLGERDEALSGFVQEQNFEYLTGFLEPGGALLLTPTEEVLFVQPRNPRQETFYGKHVNPEDKDAKAVTGFDTVAAHHTLPARFFRASEGYHKYYLLKTGEDGKALAPREHDRLRAFVPFHEELDASRIIAKLRMTKSPAELELLQRSTDASMAAHRESWRKMRPGIPEYEIQAAMAKVWSDMGCARAAYAPIVGSGPNSVVLHYNTNRRKMDAGEVVVIDVAAQCSSYASDITRTVPVNGKFTDRQREIYDIVLGAQNAAIAAAKPGVKMMELQKIAKDYMDAHGKDKKGEGLSKYFVHGLGHHVGLEVHDSSERDAALAEGHVVTIEPGIYIPEEGIGVRIEDVIVITKDGSRLMTAALPREAKDIEKLIGK